jgi:16S rRNA (uracil1498-N3)-methyltransferase
VTRRRFLADELHGDTAVLTGQNAAHLARVLRARVGQEYEIAGEGTVRIGKITIVEDDRVEFALGSPIPSPTTVPVTLLVAIFKFDRFEWAVEKATELGVATILPVIARRTDAHLAQAAAKRLDRWRRIAHEASQQSRRADPPEITEPRKLKDAMQMQSGLNIVLAESENDTMLRYVLAAQARMRVPLNSIALAVGPEGGWTDNEIQLFADMEWIAAGLGPTILRAETAVVAGLAVVGAMSSS